MRAALTATAKLNVSALIGAPCSIVSERVAPLAQFWDIPMISWAAASSDFSNKEIYPNFLRSIGPWSMMAPAFLSVMKRFSWKRIAVLHSTERVYASTAAKVIEAMIDAGIDVRFTFSFEPFNSENKGSKQKWLQEIRKGGVHIIALFGYAMDQREILLNAADMGMLADHAYFITNTGVTGHLAAEGLEDGRDDEALLAHEGVLHVVEAAASGPVVDEWKAAAKQRRGEFEQYLPPPSGPAWPDPYRHTSEVWEPIPDDLPTSDFAMFLADAVMMYALAAGKMLRERGSVMDTAALIQSMKDNPFNGTSGFVSVDKNGDRSMSYRIQHLTPSEFGFKFTDVAIYSAEQHKLVELGMDALTKTGELLWPGRSTTIPSDRPRSCESGSYAVGINADGSENCTQCPAGSFSHQSIVCTLCEPGFYSLAGSSSCSVCPSATFSAGTGQSFCQDCPAGYYAATTGQTTCKTCTNGTYSLSRTSSCISCHPGTFASENAMSACTECAVGQFSPFSGLSACHDCLPGTFQSDSGSSKCLKCNPRFYSTLPGSTTCLECPINSNNFQAEYLASLPAGLDGFVANDSRQCYCIPDHFYLDGQCEPCPEGAFCCSCAGAPACGAEEEEYTALCNQKLWLDDDRLFLAPCSLCDRGVFLPTPQPGYFRSYESAHVFLPCEPPEACVGGPKSQCLLGHTGERCGECLSNFFRVDSGFCAKCPTKNAFWTLLLVFLGGLLFLYALRVGSVMFRCGAASILFDFMQTTALFIGLKLGWPQTLTGILGALNIFNFDVSYLAPDCVFPVSVSTSAILKMAAPLFFFTPFIFLYLLLKRNVRFPFLNPAKNNQRANIISNAFFFTLSTGFTYFFRSSVAVFNCLELNNGIRYWSVRSYFHCDTPEWYRLVAVSVFSLVLYGFTIPFGFLWLLYKNRRDLNTPECAARFGSIYLVYRPELWYWETFIKLKKLLILVTVNMFPYDPSLQIQFVATVLLTSLIVNAMYRPFRYQRNNRLQTVASVCNMAALLGGMLFFSRQLSSNQELVLTVGISGSSMITVTLLVHGYIYEFLEFNARSVCERFPRLKPVLNLGLINFFFNTRFFMEHQAHWAHVQKALAAVRYDPAFTALKTLAQRRFSTCNSDHEAFARFVLGDNSKVDSVLTWLALPGNSELVSQLKQIFASLVNHDVMRQHKALGVVGKLKSNGLWKRQATKAQVNSSGTEEQPPRKPSNKVVPFEEEDAAETPVLESSTVKPFQATPMRPVTLHKAPPPQGTPMPSLDVQNVQSSINALQSSFQDTIGNLSQFSALIASLSQPALADATLAAPRTDDGEGVGGTSTPSDRDP